MKLAMLAFALAVPVFAQSQDSPYKAQGTSNENYLMVLPTHKPVNAHDSAIETLNEYWDIQKEIQEEEIKLHPEWKLTQHSDLIINFKWIAVGESSEIKIDREGKITLDNISNDDAILELMAYIIGEQKEQQLEWLQRLREEESTPPDKIKVGKNLSWELNNVPDWKGREASVTGTTNCTLHQINIKSNALDKQINIMHELMHVATDCDPSVHKAIYQLAGPLLNLMKKNPDLVAYMMQNFNTVGKGGAIAQVDKVATQIEREYNLPKLDMRYWLDKAGIDSWNHVEEK